MNIPIEIDESVFEYMGKMLSVDWTLSAWATAHYTQGNGEINKGLLKSAENGADYYKVGGYRDAVHRKGSPFFGDSEPDEEIEESQLEEEIEDVGCCEAHAVLFCCVALESKSSREEIVGTETDDVSYGVGRIFVHKRQ